MKANGKLEIAPRRQALLEEVVAIELLRTAEILSRPFAQLFKSENLSPVQYNVLRILRGSPEGLTCGEIANRMITHDPDITRLLDRMEKRNLVARGRHDKDRRVVLTKITDQGLDLLDRLDRPVRDLHRKLLGHLGADHLQSLRRLLEACRGEKR